MPCGANDARLYYAEHGRWRSSLWYPPRLFVPDRAHFFGPPAARAGTSCSSFQLGRELGPSEYAKRAVRAVVGRKMGGAALACPVSVAENRRATFVNDGWRPTPGGGLTGVIGCVKAGLVEGQDGGAA